MTITLADLRSCFEGAVPAVVATAAADGTPNVTYLSRVQMVDADRVALSNQFFSKTARNLAENPRASVLLIQPESYAQFRLTLAYERTERRGPVFERLRADVDALAAIVRMESVFKLRAADIYRVVDIECVAGEPTVAAAAPLPATELAELVARLARCTDLDTLLDVAVDGLADVFGYKHSLVLLLDEDGRSLYTIASRGYATAGVGSEVVVGEGLIGLAAERCAPMRIGSLRQMAKYSTTLRRSYEDSGEVAPTDTSPLIALPGLPDAESRVAVPALAFGQLVGVLLVESRTIAAFTEADEAVLGVIATLIANAVEHERDRSTDDAAPTPTPVADPPARGPATRVRFFDADGSVFLDDDYLIKGVAGRVLWSILNQHLADGRTDFTQRELRLDPSLDLPAFRDNLENRVILLKRRLDERDAPLRIEKTGRGRFRLHLVRPVQI